jgi:hypothetical protein
MYWEPGFDYILLLNEQGGNTNIHTDIASMLRRSSSTVPVDQCQPSRQRMWLAYCIGQAYGLEYLAFAHVHSSKSLNRRQASRSLFLILVMWRLVADTGGRLAHSGHNLVLVRALSKRQPGGEWHNDLQNWLPLRRNLWPVCKQKIRHS